MNTTNINQIQNCYNLTNFLLKTIPKFLKSGININHREQTITILVGKTNLINLLKFLKNNSLLQFKTLISITAVDYPENKNRFEVNYFLLSYKLNTRLIIKVYTNDTTPIPSITSIYSGAN